MSRPEEETKIRKGQMWRERFGPYLYEVLQKKGDRWQCVRLGGRGRTHLMREVALRKRYVLVDK